MPPDERWMHRALELASLGRCGVAPNPMVGAVLALGDRILAEGWHARPGGPHAEVACMSAFGEGPIPRGAVLYVSLEPCAHHGRTPPCCDLIIDRGIERVVIAHRDPFDQVAGRGIDRLRSAGIAIALGTLEAKARWLNRRFLTHVTGGRPYVVLKWARSRDGYLDQHPRTQGAVQRISSPATDTLVHQWRSEEQSILVGSRTVLNDDPSLSVRHVDGRQPIRIVLDRNGTVPPNPKVFRSRKDRALLFGRGQRPSGNAECVPVPEGAEPIPFLLEELTRRKISSVLVEGGGELLTHFLRSGMWDEAREIVAPLELGNGTKAPKLDTAPVAEHQVGD
ncbi:MAG: bifunctional diaminohydroxyphosphoribosylaminopyrimidine deaminase/5-amino-6-(5-phosphoribosylamino)uracil reductase RibD, partial [Flavobacteriales bacterium]|nr:bifunctional diaminohydroxyphosphoribosylaminopyrimidine deaminase/5-amino-6-(5-phosphoribosylamino)uracil reductase RibD [Flavobacteriales bacterium]